jgi:DtxR family Mn-dependent transcriptional regulator
VSLNIFITLVLSLMIVVGILLLGGVFILPRYKRTVGEDLLKLLFLRKTEEGVSGVSPSQLPRSLKERLLLRWVIPDLERAGLIKVHGARTELTTQGEEVGLHLVRAHRLWEQYLADDTELPLAEIHKQAEEKEHSLTPEVIEKLSAQLGHPLRDPHGDPIPNRKGESELPRGTPLSLWAENTPGVVIHIEDEPVKGFKELLKRVELGDQVVILKRQGEGVRVEIVRRDGSCTSAFLNKEEEERIHLLGIEESKKSPFLHTLNKAPLSLAELPLHTPGMIFALDEKIRGLERHRLLDLGFTPGARVTPVMRSRFFGSGLRGYRVRGAMIALRDRQARKIRVIPLNQREGADLSSQEGGSP